jgi:heme exporter protein D
LDEDGGFTGAVFYAGCCFLTSGMILTALDGVGDKGYKSGYVKMVGPGLVFIGLAMVMIRIMFLFVQTYKHRKKLTKCIGDKEKRNCRIGERQTQIEITLSEPNLMHSGTGKTKVLDIIHIL